VFSRQVWFRLFRPLNLSDHIPSQQEVSFEDWWRRTIKSVKKESRKGVNSLIILGAWTIWKHRNSCVFEGGSPSVVSVLNNLLDEHSLWCMAGAKKLQDLGLVVSP
jgi:hypothetical protein